MLATAVAVAFASPVFSQETNSTFKPQTGDITAEVQLNLANKDQSTFFIDQIRGRYFLNPTVALRAGASMHFWNNDINDDEYDHYDYSFTVSPGIEKHFSGTERLSPYIGSELVFYKWYHNQYHTVTDGTTVSYYGSQTRHNFGINVVAGADYYVAKRLYLGAEFGLGASYSHEYHERGTAPEEVYLQQPYINTYFSIYTITRGGIRVGFVF